MSTYEVRAKLHELVYNDIEEFNTFLMDLETLNGSAIANDDITRSADGIRIVFSSNSVQGIDQAVRNCLQRHNLDDPMFEGKNIEYLYSTTFLKDSVVVIF